MSGYNTVKLGACVQVSRGNGVGRTSMNVPVLYEGLTDEHLAEFYAKMDTPEWQKAQAACDEAFAKNFVPLLVKWGEERGLKNKGTR